MSLSSMVGTSLASPYPESTGKKITESLIKAAIAGTIAGVLVSYVGVGGVEGAGRIPTAFGSFTPVVAIGGTVGASMLVTDLVDNFVLVGPSRSTASNVLGAALEPVVAGVATLAVAYFTLPPATMATYVKLGLVGAGSIALADYAYTGFISPAMR